MVINIKSFIYFIPVEPLKPFYPGSDLTSNRFPTLSLFNNTFSISTFLSCVQSFLIIMSVNKRMYVSQKEILLSRTASYDVSLPLTFPKRTSSPPLLHSKYRIVTSPEVRHWARAHKTSFLITDSWKKTIFWERKMEK